MLTTSTSYQIIARNLPRQLNAVAQRPDVARDSAHYLASIGKVKSIDDFLGDTRLFAFAMQAFGLKDMTYARAFMRKVLEGGVDSQNAFAMQLSDSRYRDFAAAFNFKRYGAATTSFARTQQGTVDRFIRQTLEETAGQDNEGVRLALYFQRKAPQVNAILGLLADPALLKVVQTAFGLPTAMSTMSLDKQEALLRAKLNVADLRNPQSLGKLLSRFAARWDADQSGASSTVPQVQLLQGRQVTVGSDILAQIQDLKLGP